MNANLMDRRRFLAALGFAIPAVAACSVATKDALNGEPTSLPGPTPGPAKPGDAGATAPGLDVANDWEKRVAELEAQGPIYTADAPGPWADKVGTHVPQLLIDGVNVTIKTPHPMRAADDAGPLHYITTLYARDESNKIVWLKELHASDAAPVTTFQLPAGTQGLTAFSHCNLHGLWSSRHIPAGTSGATATRNDAWEKEAAALEAAGVYSAHNEGPWTGKAAKHVPSVEGGRGSVLLTVSHEMRAGVPVDGGAPDAGDAGDAGHKDGGDAGDAAPPLTEHYIGRMYVRNQDGLIVGWKVLTTVDPFPIALFSLPLGTTTATAYAWCNIHGVWKSDVFQVQG